MIPARSETRSSSNNLYQKLILMDSEARSSSSRFQAALMVLCGAVVGLTLLLVVLTKPACVPSTSIPLSTAARTSLSAATNSTMLTASTFTSSSSGSSSAVRGGIPPAAAAVYDQYFPQYRRCELWSPDGSSWLKEYAAYHADVLAGRAPPRYLVSVAVQAGLADRITGMVTQFYAALLSNRALTMTTHSNLPGFEAICDKPLFNWEHPYLRVPLPKGAIPPSVYNGAMRSEDQVPVFYPASGPLNSSAYHFMNLVNHPTTAQFWKTGNLSQLPFHNPDLPYLLSTSNRGETFQIMHNPYHRSTLGSYGLTPTSAFMCGFFSICAPNRAVVQLYKQTWDALKAPGVLVIGIKVRMGDSVFGRQHSSNKTLQQQQLKVAAPYFQCAERLEQYHALPGQKVVWYLITDALPLRIAAARRYGSKVLTDTKTATTHTDCQHNRHSCNRRKAEEGMQHALGQMLAFSMSHLTVQPKSSGFSRLGAWMSGRFDHSWEFDVPGAQALHEVQEVPDLDVVCDPERPTSPRESASFFSRV